MLSKWWNVLIVDDEPDVLAVSRLALKNMKIYGLPVKLYECQSKAQAIEFFKTNPDAQYLACAIVDVVMETENAGLELCRYIREELKNPILPLIVRTGQPGKAPEREVIDRYDISGYVGKVEATDVRLYSLLTCAVRQWVSAVSYASSLMLLQEIIPAARSRETLNQKFLELNRRAMTDAHGRSVDSLVGNFAWFENGAFVGGTGTLQAQATAEPLWKSLSAQEGQKLAAPGDRIVHKDGNVLLALAATKDAPSFDTLSTTTSWPEPTWYMDLRYMNGKSIQTLWGRAAAH